MSQSADDISRRLGHAERADVCAWLFACLKQCGAPLPDPDKAAVLARWDARVAFQAFPELRAGVK